MIDDDDKLTKYKNEVTEDFDAAVEQKDAANEDMRFCNVDGGMWEGWLEQTHGDNARRARLEIDVASDYANRYVGEWTLNRAQPVFEQNDTKTTEDDAEFLNGIFRADFSDNSGKLSQDNAVLETAYCGEGAFKLTTEYEDENDPENQNINAVWEPIYNAYNHVIWDSNAKRVDKSDANHCTLLTSYTPKAFKVEYPDLEPVSAYKPRSRGVFDLWGQKELVYVAERYEIKKEKVKISIYQHVEREEVATYDQDEIEDIKDELKTDGWEFVRERTITKRRVYKSIFYGDGFIEEDERITGEWIPIIPMYGFRSFVDGKERSRGLVRKLKDLSRMINSGISRMMEDGSKSGETLPIFTEEEIENYENIWANKHDKAYLLKNPVTDASGNQVKQPTEYLQQNQIDPNTAAVVDMGLNLVQRQTGENPQETADLRTSGEALKEVKKLTNLNTQIMTDNIITSIQHSGRVWLSIANEIYTDPRDKRLQSEDGTNTVVQLNNMVMDEESGNFIQVHDLTKGKYKVNVDVGPQYESQREATLETVERVIDKVGTESSYFAPLMSVWMENISGTGLKPLKDFNRRQMLMQGLVEPKDDEEVKLLQQLGQQSNPQDDLARAATEQQLAEARNLDSASQKNLSQSELNKAKAAEVVSSIGEARIKRQDERAKMMFDRLDKREQVASQQRLKYDPVTGRLKNA